MCGRSTHLLSFALVLGLILTNATKADLVGWWRFEEDSGGAANDSSDNGHHGTLLGTPKWGPGPEGQGTGSALMFGVDKCTASNCGIFDPTDGTGQFTLALWAFWDGTGDIQHFLTKSNGWGATTMMLQVELWGAHTNSTYTDRVGISYEPAGSVAFSVMPKNEWVHLAWTFNRSDLTLYVNGVDEVGPKPFSIGPNVDAPVLIGASDENGARIFNGLLDEVRVYSHALTVDEIKQAMKGIPPGVASEPSPADRATSVPRDVVLNWTPGEFAPAVNGHIVYLSASFTNVNDGIGGVTWSTSSYDPGRLEFETTYYWRVDEVNAPPDSTVYPGEVWSFTTEPVGYPIDGANITATASSVAPGDFGPENTIDGSGLNDNDGHSTEPLDMWMSDSLGPQPTWIQYEFDRVCKLHEMWVWNSNQAFESFLGFGLRDVTVEYSTDGAEWTTLADAPEFAQAPAPATSDYAHNTTVDFGGASAKHVRLTVNSNWASVLPQSSLSEVRFFQMPVRAATPSPDSGATGVAMDVVLGWRAGREAVTHNVYLSTDEQAVIDGTVPAVSVTDASYSSALDLNTSYYWRIDEVNDAETPTTWQGDVWDFTTQEFIVVDDFEAYNDISPPDPASNTIYSNWIDGYGIPTNGALTSNELPPYAEQTIVQGGAQSMKYLYDTNFMISEATLTLAYPKDWTEGGVTKLSLSFRGSSANFAERMFVAINGIAVVYHDDPAATQITGWKEWVIDLQAFADQDLNLTNVSTITIGVGTKNSPAAGGSGEVYFDDIRLYR